MKGKGLAIILVILALIAGCAVGFFVLPELLKEEPKTEPVESVKSLDISDEVVTSSMKKIIPFAFSGSDSGLVCGVTSPYGLYLKSDKVTAKDIPNGVALHWISVNDLKQNDDVNKPVASLTTKEVEDKIHTILDKDYSIEKKDYDGCIAYKYNKEKDSFDIYHYGCGATCGGAQAFDLFKITKAEQTGDKLEVTYKVLFSEILDEKTKDKTYLNYYTDYNRKNSVTIDKDLYEYGEDNSMYEKPVSYYYLNNDGTNSLDILSKYGSVYKFTFEKQNGNYVFISSELVK